MFNLIRMWIKREIVREITASSSSPNPVAGPFTDARQLADEIRATGSAVDVAANCLRAYMPKPFAPPRPKHPPKAVE